MRGLFITFEGTEGGGKSTQIQLLSARIRELGLTVRSLREPGGTPIGEEIRHTLKHSPHNHAMAPETELLLMCASRSQLVREVISPALEAGEIVLCDRFYDSTVAYQGYGRQMDLAIVRQLIHFAVGDIRPDLTLLLKLPLELSEKRRKIRTEGEAVQRDRFEEADREFFRRVESGYEAVAATEPQRIRVIDASASIEKVAEEIWREVEQRLKQKWADHAVDNAKR